MLVDAHPAVNGCGVSLHHSCRYFQTRALIVQAPILPEPTDPHLNMLFFFWWLLDNVVREWRCQQFRRLKK